MAEDDKFPDALEAAFAVVVAKARRDQAFARQLAKALDGALTEGAASAKAVEAPDLDPRGLLARDGAEGLRAALAPLDRKALLALIRARDLSPAGASKLNKAQLIEHVLLAAKPARGGKRVFDY
jgi:hypothetical protein